MDVYSEREHEYLTGVDEMYDDDMTAEEWGCKPDEPRKRIFAYILRSNGEGVREIEIQRVNGDGDITRRTYRRTPRRENMIIRAAAEWNNEQEA